MKTHICFPHSLPYRLRLSRNTYVSSQAMHLWEWEECIRLEDTPRCMVGAVIMRCIQFWGALLASHCMSRSRNHPEDPFVSTSCSMERYGISEICKTLHKEGLGESSLIFMADGDVKIQTAVQAFWPDVTMRTCSGHLNKNLGIAIMDKVKKKKTWMVCQKKRFGARCTYMHYPLGACIHYTIFIFWYACMSNLTTTYTYHTVPVLLSRETTQLFQTTILWMLQCQCWLHEVHQRQQYENNETSRKAQGSKLLRKSSQSFVCVCDRG